MGTSEFYRVIEAWPEIGDSLVADTGRLGAEVAGCSCSWCPPRAASSTMT